MKAGQPLYRGCTLSFSEGKRVMLKGAIPGETVKALIEDEKSDFITAVSQEVLVSSLDRITPQCPVYEDCGGCHYQHISYNRQVEMKGLIISDCLRRIAKLEVAPAPPLIDKQWRYRLRASFKALNGQIGFYKAGTREIVNIKDCLLMNEDIIIALNLIKDVLKEHVPCQIEIAGVGPSSITIIADANSDVRAVSMMTAVLKREGVRCPVFYRRKEMMGTKSTGIVELALCGIKYTLSPMVFFQSNWQLNNLVVSHLRDSIDSKGKRIVDLYAGAGNFALSLASEAKSVLAFEENPAAVKDGQRNALLNGIGNCKFVSQRAEDIDPAMDCDVAVVNPPRTGITNRAMERLLSLGAAQIVYMSCDPATFSRDLRKMASTYDIDSIRLIDFFPQTYHIESLAMLKKRLH